MSKPTGFTLIETLIAIAILTIAIVGPYAIANNAIRASRVSQDELIASLLAQEALEYVREVRDTALENRILYPGSHGGAFNELADCMSSACTIDSMYREVQVCPVVSGKAACPALYFDGQMYNQQNDGQKTAFTRSIELEYQYYYTDQVTAVATVSWSDRGKSYSYTIEETLYDWLGHGN